MNNSRLKDILVENKIYIRDKPKNHVCKCFVCGDHNNPRKQGHLWISKNPDIPVAHCFMCNYSATIPKFLFDLTADRGISKQVLTNEEMENSFSKKRNDNLNDVKTFSFKIPELTNEYPLKRLYLKKRFFDLIDLNKIPNLILDIRQFFSINNLNHLIGTNEGCTIDPDIFNELCNNFVAFLTKNQSMLICRSINDDSYFKFQKIQLRETTYLDYYCLNGGDRNSEIIVLGEGIFDIFGELLRNKLKIRDTVKLYAAGNSFSFSSLLKSICFDNDLYQVDVIILSDLDKINKYYKFKRDNSHIIRSLKIYGNSVANDFGSKDLNPFLSS